MEIMMVKNGETPEIDIVIPWVDGSDPQWQKSMQAYSGQPEGDSRSIRYRDWGLLKYVFRGIEQNLPWIRKVHFITVGHLPKWLNLECPKLHIVKHSDYIPEQWLPTFSSHPIELNIHRIAGLSERFIYLNDDMFFLKPMKPEDFFVKNKPKSQAGLDVIGEYEAIFSGVLYADREAINYHFLSRKVIINNFTKFVNLHYGFKANIKTLFLTIWCYGFFPGFPLYHGPNAFLKSTFEEVWKEEEAILSEVSSHKFRTSEDVNQYLMLWWQWCEGNFKPAGVQKKLKFFSVSAPTEDITKYIKQPACPMLCINDGATDEYEAKKAAIIDAFDSLFCEKSEFEL